MGEMMMIILTQMGIKMTRLGFKYRLLGFRSNWNSSFKNP